ncbi:MAG: hypothetical protein ABUL65_04510, partial [Opitutus sp.]
APAIYSEGVATLPYSTTPIKTQLRANIAPAPLFPNALGATTLVTLSSTGTVDSYNAPRTSAWSSATSYVAGDTVRSGTTLYRCILGHTNQPVTSTTYWVTSPLGFSAVIAGGNTSGTAVSVTGATMGGYVAAPSLSTSPYDAQAIFGTSSTPNLKNPDGTVSSAHSGSPNVDDTRISRSPYIPQFDIQSVSGGNLPNGTTYMPDNGYTLGVAPTPGTASSPLVYNITRSYTGGSYYSGLYLADTADVLIINGPVILNISGSYFGMGQGKIQINSGGSLEVYFSSSTQLYLGLSSGGGIDNQTNDPTKVFITSNHATNTVNYHYLFAASGALPFCGTIYMPNAFLTVANNSACYGALSASNVRFTTVANMHYDTSLRTAGKIGTYIDNAYLLSDWRELTNPAERVTLP